MLSLLSGCLDEASIGNQVELVLQADVFNPGDSPVDFDPWPFYCEGFGSSTRSNVKHFFDGKVRNLRAQDFGNNPFAQVVLAVSTRQTVKDCSWSNGRSSNVKVVR